MTILQGFQLDQPKVFVPWGISREELQARLGPFGLRPDSVQECSYSLSCTSLGGLIHTVGFIFLPTSASPPWLPDWLSSTSPRKLRGLRFFPNSESDIFDEFKIYQQHLEQVFGLPTQGTKTNERPHCEWRISGGVIINHYIFERFDWIHTLEIQRMGKL